MYYVMYIYLFTSQTRLDLTVCFFSLTILDFFLQKISEIIEHISCYCSKVLSLYIKIYVHFRNFERDFTLWS